MSSVLKLVSIVFLVALASSSVYAQAQAQKAAPAGPTLESRVQRLERLIENQILREMLDRLEQIQRETRELRGDLESHNHRINGLKKRQRELYIDVDRRLRVLERGGVAALPGESSTPSVSTPQAKTQSPTPPAANKEAPSKQPRTAGQSTQAAAASTPASTAPLSEGERDAYEKAFNLLREGRYEQAEGAFRGFLDKYAGGRFAANAQYWLGEVFYLRRDFDKALQEFSKVVKDHPDSPKRANALLKMGFVNYEKGEWKAARSALESVVRDYKNHSAARLARNRLNQMSQEGH